MNGRRVTAVYTRESTRHQAMSPVTQLHASTVYYNENGRLPPLLPEPYHDRATSGKTPFDERPAGHQLLLDLERGDHLIVAAYDRLGRDIPDMILTVRLLFKRGVVVHMLDLLIISRLSPDDPQIEQILTQVAGMSQFERQRISIRTRQAKAAKRAMMHAQGSGKPVGFSVVPNPDWYEGAPRATIPRRILKVDPVDKKLFETILHAWLGGEKLAVILRRLKYYPGIKPWTYRRARYNLLKEMERREAEEYQNERERTAPR